jgi:hypothetical protein
MLAAIIASHFGYHFSMKMLNEISITTLSFDESDRAVLFCSINYRFDLLESNFANAFG